MSVKDTIVSVGKITLTTVISIAGFALFLLIISGTAIAAKILPWLMLISFLFFGVNVVIFLPLALIPRTRVWGGLGFFISSYIFGLTAWFLGLLTTLIIWGVWPVIIGLFIMGVGVVPIGIVASLFNGYWTEVLVLVLSMILTFGLRVLGFWLMGKE